jgi:hypothetical protein
LTLSVFANVHLFRIGLGAALFFMDMRAKDESYFALPPRIHRILTSPQTSNQSHTLHRLNEAHPGSKFDPFLVSQLSVCAVLIG